MGQQQLLLIVVSMIIATIAIILAINMFTAASSSSNRDSVMGDLYHIIYLAQEYYKKPVEYGGGGMSYTGFVIPPSSATTGSGTYSISNISAAQITFIGTGTEVGKDGINKVKCTITLTYYGTPTLVVNN